MMGEIVMGGIYKYEQIIHQPLPIFGDNNINISFIISQWNNHNSAIQKSPNKHEIKV